MNIVLFEPGELDKPLTLDDRRAQHVIDVLRLGAGDVFDAGLIDGPRGKATIAGIGPDGVRLEFAWGEETPALDLITIIVGLPRPQSARKILEEATSLGVSEMHFVLTERGEPNYARSRLWSTDEWRRHLVDGASQAFSTRLPSVTAGRRLEEALQAVTADATLLALDNYEGACRLSEARVEMPVVVALGPERGWSEAERDLLRALSFQLVHLGERVLRVETACVSALTVVKAGLGLM